MAIPPIVLQVAGIGVLVALGAGMIFWVSRVVMGWHRGQGMIWLQTPPMADVVDDDEDADGDADGNS